MSTTALSLPLRAHAHGHPTAQTARAQTARPQTRAQTKAPAMARWLWHQRSIAALFGLVAAIFGAFVAVLAASLIGPFILFIAPLILIFGFALGPLHAMIRGDL